MAQFAKELASWLELLETPRGLATAAQISAELKAIGARNAAAVARDRELAGSAGATLALLQGDITAFLDALVSSSGGRVERDGMLHKHPSPTGGHTVVEARAGVAPLPVAVLRVGCVCDRAGGTSVAAIAQFHVVPFADGTISACVALYIVDGETPRQPAFTPGRLTIADRTELPGGNPLVLWVSRASAQHGTCELAAEVKRLGHGLRSAVNSALVEIRDRLHGGA